MFQCAYDVSGFVFGFLHLIKHCPLGAYDKPNASFDSAGTAPMNCLARYHDVLVSLSGRTSIIDPAMRYEAVGLIVYQCAEGVTSIYPGYPPLSSQCTIPGSLIGCTTSTISGLPTLIRMERRTIASSGPSRVMKCRTRLTCRPDLVGSPGLRAPRKMPPSLS